jgi:N-acetylglucosaminyl-diphospho-decaprenol L-rhamnosyltransferase
MTPRARIVVVTYDAAPYVAASIDSALAQTVPCELVAIDNASTDGTVGLLRARYPDLRVVANADNAGFGRAVTAGGLLETGLRPAFTAMLNPDACARPEWIERVTAWMDERKVDVASSVVLGGQRPFFAGGRWLPYLGVALNRAAYAGPDADWVSGCAMIVRTELFRRLGGFDPGYFLYSEDVDLCLRARALGARVGVFEEPLVEHPDPGKSSNLLGSLRKHRIAMESKGRLVRRFSRGFATPFAVLFQCLVSPALNGASVREYPALARAFLEGFRSAGPVRAGV